MAPRCGPTPAIYRCSSDSDCRCPVRADAPHRAASVRTDSDTRAPHPPATHVDIVPRILITLLTATDEETPRLVSNLESGV